MFSKCFRRGGTSTNAVSKITSHIFNFVCFCLQTPSGQLGSRGRILLGVPPPSSLLAGHPRVEVRCGLAERVQ